MGFMKEKSLVRGAYDVCKLFVNSGKIVSMLVRKVKFNEL